MNIGFTYNVRHVKPDINNPQYIKEAEFDEPETIEGITKALETLGHTVFHVEADEQAYGKLQELKNTVDLVFNIAEGMHGADREAQIPAMLEMLQIPYTGPAPLSYALALHKEKAKEVMAYYGVPTPKWRTVYNLSDLEKEEIKNIDFYPVLAKPLREGSSKGIKAKNLVYSYGDLCDVVHELMHTHDQEVLLEQYLDGREFTVAIIGRPPRVLPIVEMNFDNLPEGMPRFDHYEAKWVYENPDSAHSPFTCPAEVDETLKNAIEENCLRAFEALEMSDWSRIDVRLDRHGIPNIIEINCPPGIMPDPQQMSRFPHSARVGGLSYEQMIEEILKSACNRHGITYSTA